MSNAERCRRYYLSRKEHVNMLSQQNHELTERVNMLEGRVNMLIEQIQELRQLLRHVNMPSPFPDKKDPPDPLKELTLTPSPCSCPSDTHRPHRGHVVLQADCDRFWDAYPSRHPHANPKQPALEKFRRAVRRGADPEEIIEAAERYREMIASTGTDPRHVAQAVTWLNQQRWISEETNGNHFDHEPVVPLSDAQRKAEAARGIAEALAELRRREEEEKMAACGPAG